MTRPVRAVSECEGGGFSCPRGTSPPASGPRRESPHSLRLLWLLAFPRSPRVEKAGGFSVPLGLVAQEGSELTLCHSAALHLGVFLFFTLTATFNARNNQANLFHYVNFLHVKGEAKKG